MGIIRTLRRALGPSVAALCLLNAADAAAIEAGGKVPAAKGPRLDAAGDLALDGFRGKVLYVDFWASWCVPCRLSLPTLESLSQRHGKEGFVVVGVNKDATRDDAERFLKRVPVTFPLVADADDRIAKAFAVKAMPSGYLVDRKGVVRHVHRGFTEETAKALEREIPALLKEAP